MKKNILVSGASGILGYGILRSLREKRDEYRLIGTTIYDFSVAPAFCDVFEKALPTTEPNYIDWLCSILKKHSIDMLIPGIECDMFHWNKNRETISSTGALPLLNNNELIELCFDKWKFYEKLIVENSSVAIPTVINGSFNTFPTPFILKPRRGFGSKGIVKVNKKTDFKINIPKIGPELMIQPIFGNDDEEYTVSAFFDKTSHLIDHLPLKRKLSNDGFTNEAQVVDFNFENIICDLAKSFKPVGATNFQFRVDNREVKLLEINPRISSATSIRTCLGYNESIMSANYFLENIITPKCDKTKIKNKRAIRYVEDYIF